LSKGDTATVKWWGEGTFSLSVYPSNDCGDGPMNNLSIEVRPKAPKPVITLIDGFMTSSITLGNQWYYNGEIIEGATAQTMIASNPGEYTVQVTNDCGKGEMSESFLLNITGLDNKSVNEMKIYPNPAQQKIYIDLDANIQWQYISLVNLHGIEVKRITFNNNTKVR
jgi:hypothetical protein